MAGAIKETATYTLSRDFRNIDTRTARVILIQAAARLLNYILQGLGKNAYEDLESMGIEVRLNSYVTSVDDTGLFVGDERLQAENVIWSAGIDGLSLVKELGVELDNAGRVYVNPDLSIPGHPNVFVSRDAAHIIDQRMGQTTPSVAKGAIQMGELSANLIKHDLNGLLIESKP